MPQRNDWMPYAEFTELEIAPPMAAGSVCDQFRPGFRPGEPIVRMRPERLVPRLACLGHGWQYYEYHREDVECWLAWDAELRLRLMSTRVVYVPSCPDFVKLGELRDHLPR